MTDHSEQLFLLEGAADSPAPIDPAPPEPADVEAALPPLDAPAARARAEELVRRIDPTAADQIPETLSFPATDDPFTRTAEEWEALWYASRESALRVYLNARMEFRRHYARAAAGEPGDLRPWTYWAFNGVRPAEGEPVYGLTDQRRSDLGWNYPGEPDEFLLYRTPAEEDD